MQAKTEAQKRADEVLCALVECDPAVVKALLDIEFEIMQDMHEDGTGTPEPTRRDAFIVLSGMLATLQVALRKEIGKLI